MAVSPGEVRRIAELARLRLDPAEVEAMAAELSVVLAHMEALARLEPGDGTGPRDPDPAPSTLRPDEPGPDPLAVPPAELAPGFSDGLFTLPRLVFRPDRPADPDDGAGGSP